MLAENFRTNTPMGRSKSSSRWLNEHFSDPFVKRAHVEGMRSRAAYKLEELLERDLVLRPGMVVVDLGAAPGGWIKPELVRCSVEIATAASADHRQLAVDLRALRGELTTRANAAGMSLVALGAHPDLQVTSDEVSPTDAHQGIAALHESAGTLAEQVTHGIHVHVGMPSLAEAVAATDALAAVVPMLIAVTANSAYLNGMRSPWRSARAEHQRRLIWGGPPPRFADVTDYEITHLAHQLESSGPQRFLWEVAPVCALGTVEVRAADANADSRVALGVAAFVQAVAARSLEGGSPPRANESLERHNRWSAMSFGARARFLLPRADTPVDVAHVIAAELESLRPYARELGGEPSLAIFEELLAIAPSEMSIVAFERGGVEAVISAAALAGRAPG